MGIWVNEVQEVGKGMKKKKNRREEERREAHKVSWHEALAA